MAGEFCESVTDASVTSDWCYKLVVCLFAPTCFGGLEHKQWKLTILLRHRMSKNERNLKKKADERC